MKKGGSDDDVRGVGGIGSEVGVKLPGQMVV